MLGIDPGLTRCGYAVVDGGGPGTATAVALGVIRTPAGDVPSRLAALRRELAALIAEYGPAAVAVEQVFFQVNVRTAMSVGQASGLALAEAAAAGCEVVQYTPNQVKDAVAGWGGASKEQVQKMVQARLRLARPPRPPTPPTPPRWRCAIWRWRRCAADRRSLGGPRCDRVAGGEVLERGLDGTVLSRSAASGTSSSCRRARFPSSSRRRRSSCTSTTTSARTARRCTGSTREERSTFQTLIATHGVGPALAMAILATHPPAALVDIVAAGDVGALTLVPGVGRKTAERLLVELKSRLSVRARSVGGPSGGSAVGDVREALSGLGYGSEEMRGAARAAGRPRRADDAAGRAQAARARRA